MKSIRTKLVFLLSLSAAIALLLSSVTISIYNYYEKKRENIRTLYELTLVITENLIAPVEFYDESTSKVILKTLQSDSDIKGAFVFNSKNTMLSSYIKDINNSKKLREITYEIYKFNDIKDSFKYIYLDYVVINHPILSDGEYLGSLLIISGTDSLDEMVINGLLLQVLVSIITLIIIILLAIRMQRIFTVPILELKNVMQEVTNKHNYDILIKLNSSDEFKTLSDGLNSMLETIRERTKQIQTLLDHADQGFLSFSKDLMVHNQYSKECMNIFSKKIGNIKITDLLFDGDDSNKEFFEQTLIDLFEDDEETSNLIISLLPKEFYVNNKYIDVQYKQLDSDRFMLILTDATEQKRLEKELDSDKSILRMVVTSVREKDDLFELLENYESFIKNVKDNVSPVLIARDNIAKLYIDVHTYKGLFLQKDFINIPKGLHILETKLSEMLNDISQENRKLLELLDRVKFSKWLENDKNILIKAIGEDFFDDKGNIIVKNSNFDNLENRVKELLKTSTNTLLDEEVINSLKMCRYKSLFKQLEQYSKLVERLSITLHKRVNPLVIEGDDTIYTSKELTPFIESLIHIFRNSVDHGIDSAEERIYLKKPEYATISCNMSRVDNNIVIEISDDGAGIDIQYLKKKAKEKNIFADVELNKMSEEEIMNIIFNDYFSTSETITTISGRGIGLSSLKYEVNNLGGKIKISTKVNIGTTFTITIPKSEYVI